MFAFNTDIRPPASEGIKIINELLSEEQKQLLTLKLGSVEITPLKQLTSLYGGLYCLYSDLDEFQCRAANILNRQLLDFKKLAVREQTLAEQANIESYYQVTDRFEKGTKATGIKGSMNSGANNISANTLKNREGQAAYSKEFDMEKLWDTQNIEQMQFATTLQDKHTSSKDWQFEEKQDADDPQLNIHIAKEVEAPKESESAPKAPEVPEISRPPASEDEDEDKTVVLNTININSQSNLNYTKSNAYSETGRRVESGKANKTITKQYTKGRAIRAFQEATEADIRERIFARFEVLFTNRQCQ